MKMLSTPKSRGELFLASSLRDGLEDNDLRQVETLLSSKEADPNVLIPTHGISPFHLVIGNESERFAEQVSKLFLRHGGDPNVRSVDGMTPVHVAAAWGRTAVLELLLANGGDPLCLDDDARTPFHYAFDGAYYDAVATLGKYCGMNRNEEEEVPKYKLTLDKILINKGTVVAEYVPSEDSRAVSLKSSSESLLKISTPPSSSTNGEWSTSDNVTLRRYNKSPSKMAKKIADIGSAECNVDEERLLISQIIDRLSNTLASDSSPSGNNDETAVIKKITNNNDRLKNLTMIRKAPLPRTLLAPAPSTHRNLITKQTSSRRLIGETSIISKSPNCRLSTRNDKTPKSRGICRMKYGRDDRTPPLTPSKQRQTTRIKSASSTPKKKRYSGRLYGSAKLSPKKPEVTSPFHAAAHGRKATTTLKDKIVRCSDTQLNSPKRVNGKYKNIAIKLDERMSDENPEVDNCQDYYSKYARGKKVSSEPVRLIHNNIKTEVKNENTKNYEDKVPLFESPGSSTPLSVCRFKYTHSPTPNRDSTLSNGDEDEDTRILLEIEEACGKRCGTPPASVSMLDVDEGSDTTLHSDYSSGGNSSFCEFHEAYSNLGSMRSRCESFVSVDEEYTYEDTEEGIAFIERHLRVIPSSAQDDMNRAKDEVSWIDRLSELTIDSSDYSLSSTSTTVPRSVDLLDDRVLRERLTALGEMPGPITKTTFNLYVKRLWRLERARKRSGMIVAAGTTWENGAIETEGKITENPGKEIPEFLLSTDWTTKQLYYRKLEEEAFKEYAITNSKRKYRGGISKTSFCYLLLDPRITKDLPRTGLRLTLDERWKRFLAAVFYVGKGKAARPAAHLYDAYGLWSKGQGNIVKASRKIRRILDIWKAGHGVVCLDVFSHTMMEEAHSREAAIIEALGTSHLTNCLHGTYYGYATTMSSREKQSLGKYLLYKSMEIFIHEVNVWTKQRCINDEMVEAGKPISFLLDAMRLICDNLET